MCAAAACRSDLARIETRSRSHTKYIHISVNVVCCVCCILYCIMQMKIFRIHVYYMLRIYTVVGLHYVWIMHTIHSKYTP